MRECHQSHDCLSRAWLLTPSSLMCSSLILPLQLLQSQWPHGKDWSPRLQNQGASETSAPVLNCLEAYSFTSHSIPGGSQRRNWNRAKNLEAGPDAEATGECRLLISSLMAWLPCFIKPPRTTDTGMARPW